MKKWLIALGLTSALIAAGCSSSDEGNTNGDSQSEETSDKSNDEQAMKKEVLNAQMNLKDTFHPYQSKISAYQSAVAAEEPDEEQIKSTGEEAKKAAQDAAKEAENYEVKADLSDEAISTYEEALPSLQAYYEGVAEALNNGLKDADLSKAEEKFTEFNDTLGKIYEDVGLNPPDMMKEFS
ncbi:hypothetical protein MUN89_12320 [Halobacillus salinarum]|uniref:Lipoprotein n=1 Tax=Halobacillus salinarum TaxID=2932257 RepID=A0ABY4EH26_9BACI|nr:hypothetical protein [Halobacillus salinarum]UOQ42752.1 hypothetical protein MUN89_12320 [Halobacillus salinarum]